MAGFLFKRFLLSTGQDGQEFKDIKRLATEETEVLCLIIRLKDVTATGPKGSKQWDIYMAMPSPLKRTEINEVRIVLTRIPGSCSLQWRAD